MTPPAAAAAPRTRTNRSAPPPRRVSGPAHPARGRARTAAAVAGPPPLALRLGGAVHSLAEHHFLDRIVRGRAWIAILAVGLIGIVFMQVSMLRLNAGIGSAVEKSSVLERQNSATRAAISELSSGDRIAAEALKLGLVLPPGTARFLDARGVVASRAAAAITPPGVGIIPSATTTTTPPVFDPTAAATPVLSPTGVAPSTATTTQTETATAAPPADPAATQTAVPTAPAAPAVTPPATQDQATATQTAPPPPADTTGGVDAPGAVG